MKETNYHFRTKLLQIFLEKDVSPSTKSEISLLFKNIEEEKKENLAEKIIPLIESSKTEQEMLRKVNHLINQNTLRTP